MILNLTLQIIKDQKMKNKFLFLCFTLMTMVLYSQKPYVKVKEYKPSENLPVKQTKEQYISQFYKVAIEEMNLYKIPASITLAQGILETESGNSDLARIGKNHFGIKCKNTWTGMKYIKDDDTKDECFRAYTTAEESFRDHSLFLSIGERYKFLFKYDMKDYKSWAYGLKSAGYATNPNYPLILIKHIEELKLYEFDNYGSKQSDIKEDDGTGSLMIDPVKVYKDSLALKVTKKNIANNLKLVVVDSAFDVQEIAVREKTTLQNLYMFNELEGEQPIIIGQNFFLQAKLKVNQLGAHEVKLGQSLYDISQIYGVTTQSLRALNRLEKWEQPAVGESVFLSSERNSYMRTRSYFAVQQEKEAVAEEQKRKQVQTIVSNMTSNPSFQKIEVAQTIPNTDKQIIIHKVAPQENIFKISKRYKVSPNDLLKWNDLTIEKPLSVGQSLKIIINLNN